MTFPLIRHLSKPVTWLLAKLPISANQITAISLLVGLACAWVLSFGDPVWDIIGAVLLVTAYVLDNCDGEIARLRNQCSDFGMHFDNFVDWIVHAAFFTGLGFGVTRTTGTDMWLWLGLAAAAGSTINYVAVYFIEARDRKRALQQGDDVRVRHLAPDDTRKPETAIDWLIYCLRELSRADFCFIVLGLSLLNGLWLLLPAAAIGAQVYWITQFSKDARDFRV